MTEQMDEPSRWYRGHSDAVADIQAEAEVEGWSPAETIKALYERGLLPKPTYHVPSLDEMYGLMRDLRYAVRYGKLPVRWVMCRETVDVLARRFSGRLSPDVMPPLSFQLAPDDGALPDVGIDALNVVERGTTGPAMLFGVPIRVDPAARTPLFEVKPDGG